MGSEKNAIPPLAEARGLLARDTMKVLVGCEESQTVCTAFRKLGHDAFSCDITECSGGHPEWHIKDDVLNHLRDGWDIGIFHPPCTYLTVSGNKWMKPEFRSRFPDREKQREDAKDFFMALIYANIPKIAVENPIGIMSSVYRKPDQIIQPWMFGHAETKATCLWEKGLPKLKPTNMVALPIERSKRMRLHYLPRTPERSKLRSKTFQGIADAMADQWGIL